MERRPRFMEMDMISKWINSCDRDAGLLSLGLKRSYTVLDVLVDQWPAILGLIWADSLRWEMHGCILKPLLLASRTLSKSSGGGERIFAWGGLWDIVNVWLKLGRSPQFSRSEISCFIDIRCISVFFYFFKYSSSQSGKKYSIITHSFSQQECLQEAVLLIKLHSEVNHLMTNPTAVCYLGWKLRS